MISFFETDEAIWRKMMYRIGLDICSYSRRGKRC